MHSARKCSSPTVLQESKGLKRKSEPEVPGLEDAAERLVNRLSREGPDPKTLLQALCINTC